MRVTGRSSAGGGGPPRPRQGRPSRKGPAWHGECKECKKRKKKCKACKLGASSLQRSLPLQPRERRRSQIGSRYTPSSALRDRRATRTSRRGRGVKRNVRVLLDGSRKRAGRVRLDASLHELLRKRATVQ